MFGTPGTTQRETGRVEGEGGGGRGRRPPAGNASAEERLPGVLVASRTEQPSDVRFPSSVPLLSPSSGVFSGGVVL